MNFGGPHPGYVGLSAVGTTAATATLLSSEVNVFSTVVSGGCAILPESGASEIDVYVYNEGSNTLTIYPPSRGQIVQLGVSLGIGVAVSLAPGQVIQFKCVDPAINPGLNWRIGLNPTGSTPNVINVLNYAGVDRTGTTDSTAGLQTALTAAVSAGSGAALLVPPGVYLYSGNLTATLPSGTSLTIIGYGQDVSDFRCTGSAPGITITYPAGAYYFTPNSLTVKDMTFTVTTLNTNAAFTVNGNFVTGVLTSPTTFSGCKFGGTNVNVSQWAVNIAFNAVAQTVVEKCSFFGKYAAYSATSIKYAGTPGGIATDHMVDKCSAFYMQYAIYANTYTQGVLASKCNFTDVAYGVYGAGVIGSAGAGFSDLQELSITGSQIDATVSCVYITGGVDCQITDNLFILRTPDGSSTPPTNAGVVVLDSCIRCKASGNNIVGTTTNTGQTGVLFSNGQGATQFSYPNTVDDNILNSLQTGIQVAAGSVGTIIGQNDFSVGGSVATRVLDNGTSTVYLPVSVSTGSVTPRSLADRGADWFNVKDYGAVGDGVYISAAIPVQAGTPPQLVVSGAAFKTTDVGKFLSVTGIGSAGAALATTIASCVNATTITVANAASTFVTSSTQTVVYGTDDSAAIQAAFTAAGAGVAGNSTKAASRIGNNYPTTVLFPDAIYIVRTTLDATSYIGGTIRGFGGAWLYGAITPQVNSNAAVIDAINGYNTKIDGISIYGDAGLTPTTGIQWGRYRAPGTGVPATGRCAMSNVTTSGYFSIAAVYAMMCETTVYTNLNLNNAANAAGGYSAANPAAAMIDDGSNRFGLTSYLTFTLSANVAVTNTVVTYIGCRFIASGTGSPGLWMSNVNGRRLIGCYWSSPGDATVVIYMTSSIRSKDLVFWGNMEGNNTTLQADSFYFDGSGNTLISGLDVRTSANNPGANLFNNNASITLIKADDIKVSADAVPLGTTVFANPSVWNIGNGDFSFSSAAAGWNYPASFYGRLNIAEVTTWYNNSQPAPMTPNYGQTIGGTTGAVSAITYNTGASPGIWKIDGGGALSSTVGPQITVNPPPSGGTQASIAVVSMGLTSTGQGTITNGGTGYVVNDILTMSGGVGTAPQVKVTAVSSGVVTTVTQQTVGALTTLPASPYTWTGGTGTGFTTTSANWKIPASANLSITAAGSGYQAAQAVFSLVSGTVLSSGAPTATLTLNGNVTVSGGGIQQIATSSTQLSLGAAGTTNPVPVMTLGAQHDTAIAFIASASVTNGATQTAAANTDGMYLKNAANVATQTILLPPFTGVAGQTFWVASLGGIGTTATFQTSAAGAITGAPTTIAAGGVHRFVADTNTWYPQG